MNISEFGNDGIEPLISFVRIIDRTEPQDAAIFFPDRIQFCHNSYRTAPCLNP